jgi:ribosomal protein S18 acetylase RimI-like enzyme
MNYKIIKFNDITETLLTDIKKFDKQVFKEKYYGRRYWKALLENNQYCCVVYDNELLVGLIATHFSYEIIDFFTDPENFHLIQTEEDSKIHDKEKCYITSLAVLQEYRNKKIASQLMKNLFEFLEKEYQEKSSNEFFISLDVWKDNTSGIEFYKKMGFEIVGDNKHDPSQYVMSTKSTSVPLRTINNKIC